MYWLNSIIKATLLKRGVALSRPPGQFNVGDYKLATIRARGLQVRCAIDGGAANGSWARQFKRVYPGCQILCVEPRKDVQDELRAVARELGGVQVAQTLLGPQAGEVEFNEFSDQSSVLMDSRGQRYGRTAKAKMSTLDGLVQEYGLPPPDLIKLDLQGYELEALRGGEVALRGAQVVLMEVSFLRLQASAPIAHEVIAFMAERGFVTYDVLALWNRPLDGALAQGDFLFLNKDHPLLVDGRWSSTF